MYTATDFNYLVKEKRLAAKAKERQERKEASLTAIGCVVLGIVFTFNVVFSF